MSAGSFLSFPAYGMVLIDHPYGDFKWMRKKNILNEFISFSGNVAGFHVKRSDFGKHMPNDE